MELALAVDHSANRAPKSRKGVSVTDRHKVASEKAEEGHPSPRPKLKKDSLGSAHSGSIGSATKTGHLQSLSEHNDVNYLRYQ